uniref:Uncharacterized protein LOC111131746 n=1 Tax=Crassostrea virginica TaxID=6565 RepID=A0A8B8E6W3_CRAVI|nr:uncharacterized protein LOC111131746 [Crassostrea virginica]
MTSVTDKSSTVSREQNRAPDEDDNQHVIHQQTIASAPSIDVSSLTSICLAVLVVSNVFFTVLFYCAWKKRQKNWQQQLNRPENSRQQQTFVDHVSSKEEVSKWDLSTRGIQKKNRCTTAFNPKVRILIGI